MDMAEVLKGLAELTDYWEARAKHDRSDKKGTDNYYMNVCAEAAVLLMEEKREEDDGK